MNQTNEPFEAICQVCGEKILWTESLGAGNPTWQWQHESTGTYRKAGHFAFVREGSMMRVETVTPASTASEVAFW